MEEMVKAKLIFMFPGQGSQKERMGKDIFTRYEKAKQIWAMASDIYGEDLAEICFKKPYREMQRTDHAQILIGTISVTLLELLKEEGICPDIVLGHSAGEMAALYASGAVGLEDIFKLITCRGKFMYKSAKQSRGKMVVIKDIEHDHTSHVMEKYREAGVISLANYNAPTQFVITGDYDTVSKFQREMSKITPGEAVDLEQQGAWHSVYMTEARQRFAEVIAKIELKKPCIPIIFNYSAEFKENIEEIRVQLTDILTAPVLWYQCLRKLSAYTNSTFAEVGPNKILRGLLRRSFHSSSINSYKIMNVNDTYTLDKAVSKMKEKIVVEPGLYNKGVMYEELPV